MARFRGTVQGGRSIASRLGHSTTGLKTSANGWHCGVEVRVTDALGEDLFEILVTDGSQGCKKEILAIVYRDDSGKWTISDGIQNALKHLNGGS